MTMRMYKWHCPVCDAQIAADMMVQIENHMAIQHTNRLRSFEFGPLFLAVENWYGDHRLHFRLGRLVLKAIWVGS